MSGIRVTIFDRSENVTERLLNAHFANPENGGGKISSIHYPMFGKEAVIIFEDEHTAEFVYNHRLGQKINGDDIMITVLPKLQVFRKLEAEVDPAATAFLQVTESARDEIIHHGNLDYRYDDKTDTAYMTGTWYQLEWAWKYVDAVMHQQEKALSSSAHRKERKDMELRLRQKARDYSPSRYRGQDDASDRRSEIGTVASIDGISGGDIQLAKGTTRIPGDNTGVVGVPDTGSEADFNRSLEFRMDKTSRRGVEAERYESRGTAETKVEDKTSKLQRTISEQGAGNRQMNTETRVARSMSVEDKDSDDLRGIGFIHEGMKIRLYTDDITSAKTDAIVNTGKGHKQGVSYAIIKAADPVVYYEIKDYFEKHGHLETGDVIHTSAGGDLHNNVKFIFHAVGPIWTEDLQQDVGAFQLTTTFLNCLKRANKLKLSSIMFPAISTGTYMGSVEVCAKSFLDAVLLYAFEHRDKHSLKEVHLVNIDANTTAMMVLTLRQALEKGMDLLTIEATEEMERLQTTAKKNPGLFAKMKAGVSEFLCGSKKAGAVVELSSGRTGTNKQKTTGTVKPQTSNRPLPKPSGRTGK